MGLGLGGAHACIEHDAGAHSQPARRREGSQVHKGRLAHAAQADATHVPSALQMLV